MTVKELIAKAYKDSELSGREYKRLVDYVESIMQDTKGRGKWLIMKSLIKNVWNFVRH